MHLYKRTGSSKHYGNFKDHLGIKRRVALSKNREQAIGMGKAIDEIVQARAENRTPRQTDMQALTPKVRQSLVRSGIIDGTTNANLRDVFAHIEDYTAVLRAESNTDNYVQQTARRVTNIIKGCGVYNWSELTGSGVKRFISELKTSKHSNKAASAKTQNDYLAAIKGFCRWAVRDRRLAESPIEHLQPLDGRKVENDRRHERRALSVEDVQKLLDAARTGRTMTHGKRAKHHWCLTGQDRY